MRGLLPREAWLIGPFGTEPLWFTLVVMRLSELLLTSQPSEGKRDGLGRCERWSVVL